MVLDAVGDEDSEGVDLDRILEEEIGGFGKYQFKVIVLCAVVNLFRGYSENESVYTAAKIQSRCIIPECDNEENFSPPWIFNAVPLPGSDGSFEGCLRFANSSVSQNMTMDYTCPQGMFDRGLLVECDSHVYEHQNSAFYEFDLACDERRQSLITYMTLLGMILGLPITGFFSDRYGRQVTMCVTSINYAWIGAVKYWAGSYETFVGGLFVENFLGGCSSICAFILALETVSSKHRAAVGCIISICHTLGEVLQGLVASTQPNWRIYILITNVPQLLAIVYFWISSESVRWLISKGRIKEARSILANIAQTNGRKLSEITSNRLTGDRKRKSYSNKDKWMIALLFQHKSMIQNCFLTAVLWISISLLSFGLTNAPVIYGNKFWNDVALNAVAIPGFCIGYYLMNRFGRKPLIIGGFLICGACQMTCTFIAVNNEYYALSLSLYLILKICVSTVMSVMYVYTSELYPTQYRTRLLCYAAMIQQLGTLLAFVMSTLGPIWEHFVFGILALGSSLLVLLAPETLGTTLPDSMQEAASFGQNPSVLQYLRTLGFRRKSYSFSVTVWGLRRSSGLHEAESMES